MDETKNNPAVTDCSHFHTAKEWERQRKTFEQLYVTEDKPLEKVVEEMHQVHGFKATQRQYKRKIAAWHLDKNIKDEEMRAMLWMQKKRKTTEGKDSHFYVRGRRVEPSKMARYARRKKTLQDLGTPPRTLPPDIRCHTPHSQNLPGPADEVEDENNGNSLPSISSFGRQDVLAAATIPATSPIRTTSLQEPCLEILNARRILPNGLPSSALDIDREHSSSRPVLDYASDVYFSDHLLDLPIPQLDSYRQYRKEKKIDTEEFPDHLLELSITWGVSISQAV